MIVINQLINASQGLLCFSYCSMLLSHHLHGELNPRPTTLRALCIGISTFLCDVWEKPLYIDHNERSMPEQPVNQWGTVRAKGLSRSQARESIVKVLLP